MKFSQLGVAMAVGDLTPTALVARKTTVLIKHRNRAISDHVLKAI